MKKIFDLITLLLAFTIIITSIASCSSKIDDGLSSDSDESGYGESGSDYSDNLSNFENGDVNYTPEIDFSKFPENAFPIFDGTAYTLKVVVAEKAVSTVRQVATNLRSELKKKTNATILESDDHLKVGATFDANAYEILVGETKHIESASIYAATDYNNYGIKTIGKKIVFYFSSADEGNELVKIFMNAVKSNNENAFWVEKGLSASKITTVNLSGVPKYPASSLSTVDCNDNTSMVVAKSTTLEKFNEYCTTLTSSGYAEYSRRENVDGNYFRTYTKGATAITAYFSNGRKQARIIVGPLKDIPPNDTDPTPETFNPSLTFVAQSDNTENGLALVYMLPNGKFIIIDGGYFLSDKIYKKLRELQPNAARLTIAAWFVSHPHIDHQENLENFIKNHAYEVDIEGIYFNYALPDYYNNFSDPEQTGKEGPSVIRLHELIEKYCLRTTKIVKPHTGQIYSFGKNASVEIISTVEDFLPTKLDNVNTTSMMVRVTVAGTSTLITGDATSTLNDVVLKMYNSHLKSDIVTLAHHGIWVDTPELYRRVKASVLLWPCNTSRAKEFYNKNYSKTTIRTAIDLATDVYLAKGTDNNFALPYKHVNNKAAFNSFIKS